jgi:hypothetical protein
VREQTANVRSREASIIDADMLALVYREDAWVASERRAPPPDPTRLSDRALWSVLRYDEGDLPRQARQAIANEYRRRRLMAAGFGRFFAVVVLAGLSLFWLVVAWVVFAR